MSTGTNWNRAPHSAILNQPMQTTCTNTSVSGDATSALGAPNPTTIRTSAASNHAIATAK
ncbi:Uncharacterised protein [Mycobacterium tuberculosis]|nr:Uncharacterised protein [Mycobacterium tuberculosis]